MAITKWLGHSWSTGCYPGDDYLKFQQNARTELKKQIIPEGFELASFNKNHYCFSAVLKHTASNGLIYVSISDVRSWPDEWYSHVLIRTMAHEKDWTGGMNNYCRWDDIASTAKKLLHVA